MFKILNKFKRKKKSYFDIEKFVATVRDMRMAQMSCSRNSDMVNYQNARYYEGEVDKQITEYLKTQILNKK